MDHRSGSSFRNYNQCHVADTAYLLLRNLSCEGSGGACRCPTARIVAAALLSKKGKRWTPVAGSAYAGRAARSREADFIALHARQLTEQRAQPAERVARAEARGREVARGRADRRRLPHVRVRPLDC